jgi:hypothetical protein
MVNESARIQGYLSISQRITESFREQDIKGTVLIKLFLKFHYSSEYLLLEQNSGKIQ